MEIHHGFVPPPRPARRRKSAKERRAQKLRATARAFQHVAQALNDVQGHRGGKLRNIGIRWHAHVSAPHVHEIPMPRFLNLEDAVPSHEHEVVGSARAVLVGVEPISISRHSSAEVAHITSSGTEELGSLPTSPDVTNIQQHDLDTLLDYSRSQLVEKIRSMREAAIWRRYCDEFCENLARGLQPDYGAAYTPVASLRYFLLISQHYGYYGIDEDIWYYGTYRRDAMEGRFRPFYPAGFEKAFTALR